MVNHLGVVRESRRTARQNCRDLESAYSPKRVREIVELLYQREESLTDKLAWRLLKRQQPYAAEFVRLAGVDGPGEITCGHNPWLRARLVDNLTIETGTNGKETGSWNDRYSAREMAEKTRRLKAEGATS